MTTAFQCDAFQDDTFQMDCSPTPPEPVVAVEQRRWPGPSILLHYDDNDTYYNRQQREENEIIIL